LEGLEQFRDGGNAATSKGTVTAASSTKTTVAVSTTKSASLSPMKPMKSPSVSVTTDSDDDDYYDEDNIFGVGEGDGQKLLDISIDATALSAASSAQQTNPREFGAGAKRRRSHVTTAASSSSPAESQSTSTTTGVPIVKKPKALSSQNFFDIFQSVANLDERYKSSVNYIKSIPPSYLSDSESCGIDDLVGDELTEMYKKVCQTQRNVLKERRAMYTVAVQRRELEKEARRYISWLKNLAKVDDEDIDF
jgi:hypothetical protein